MGYFGISVDIQFPYTIIENIQFLKYSSFKYIAMIDPSMMIDWLLTTAERAMLFCSKN